MQKMDIKTAEKKIDITSEKVVRQENTSLSRAHSSKDRMLRCKCANNHFFVETFFATKSTAKSSRGNNCVIFFVKDKSFIHLVKEFSKEHFFTWSFFKNVSQRKAVVAEP